MNVSIHHITKRFGSVLANDDISFTIEAGTIHGLLGENGAGKSTLVKILSGFIQHDYGELWLDDRPVTLQSPKDAIRLGIGMLHQDPLDCPRLSVLENFMLGGVTPVGAGWRLNRRDGLRNLRELSNQFNFSLNPQERVINLSIGERQQLELLRLLSLKIRLLILDEPTTGISAIQKEALFAALKQLVASEKSILFVSHKLEDITALCDRVTILRQGKVSGAVEIGAVQHTSSQKGGSRSREAAQSDALITLMFGSELAAPTKPQTVQPVVNVTLRDLVVTNNRLRVTLSHFSANRGEVIGLAGLEGSGQHLFLQCCAGLRQPRSGQIQLADQNLSQEPYATYLNAGVGYLPADRLRAGLIGDLSIYDHVALRSSDPGWIIPRAKILEKTRQAITQFSIRGKPNTSVTHLSGGNQQRAQIALLPPALHLLLLEHPTRGLDLESANWVWQHLLTRAETGTTLFFMSVDLDEIMQYSDRILVFHTGQISAPLITSNVTIQMLGQAIAGTLSWHSEKI